MYHRVDIGEEEGEGEGEERGHRGRTRTRGGLGRGIALLIACFVIALIVLGLKVDRGTLIQWNIVQRQEHPIRALTRAAELDYQNRVVYARQLQDDLGLAKSEYQRQFHRLPPLGFDAWHAFAREHAAPELPSLMAYTGLMDALEPFRAIPPLELRARSWALIEQGHRWMFMIKVKAGQVSVWEGPEMPLTPDSPKYAYVSAMVDMISQISHRLPDLEIPYNTLDEARSTAPYETVERYRRAARNGETISQHDGKLDGHDLVEAFRPAWFADPSLAKVVEAGGSFHPVDPLANETVSVGGLKPLSASELRPWHILRDSCPPNSTIRATGGMPEPRRTSQRQAFVNQVPGSLDLCNDPDAPASVGQLVKERIWYPVASRHYLDPSSRTKPIASDDDSIWPVFSQSKMRGYLDILLPGRFVWDNADPAYVVSATADAVPWEMKESRAYWRGSASGGFAVGREWRIMLRQRFVSLANRVKGTVQLLEMQDDKLELKEVEASELSPLVNVALTKIACKSQASAAACRDQKQSAELRWTAFEPPETINRYKILPDVDGIGWSARFVNLLKTGGLVVKAQLYYDWLLQDSFLGTLGGPLPWVHYAPLDYALDSFYTLVNFYLGPGEAVGKEMGLKGALYARTNGRQADMLIYTYRLCLEWAAMQAIEPTVQDQCRFGGCPRPTVASV